jgi:hypothetical protein
LTDDTDLTSMGGLVRRIRHAGNGGARVSVADVVDEIGDDAFAPLLLVPALVLISPVSAIPGLSTLGGLIMALIAMQMVLGVRRVWLPGILRRRTIAKTSLDKAANFLERPARFIDRFTRRRLAALTAWPLSIVPSLICVAAALVIPLFELIPMSSTIISTAIALFALAMVTRDGILLVFGLAVLGGAGVLIWNLAT